MIGPRNSPRNSHGGGGAAIGGFVPPAALIAKAARALVPPERIDVPTAARRYRKVVNGIGGYAGPWTDERTTYLVRPMLCLTSALYRIVAFMGPAQSAKSAMAENWLTWGVVVEPAPMLWSGPDKKLLQDYVVQKINPLIRNSDEIRARQLRTASADNIFSKEFLGNMWLNFVWPVASNFRMRTAPRWVVDDFDAIPADIEGEGDILFLLGGRTTAHERTYRGLVLSSPSRKPGHCDIEALVETGTDERPFWRCPSCEEWFSPDFDAHLAFERTSNPEDAAQSAELVCPNNGCRLKQSDKPGLLASLVWVGAGQAIDTATGAITGELRRTHIASFRVNGLMGFNTWSLLARECRTAELALERAQDEGPLRTFYNTKIGVNYRSRLDENRAVSLAELRGRSEDEPMRQVPAGARFLTAAVDVQSNRFEVLVMAWGADDESWIVDRFQLMQIADAGGRLGAVIRPHREIAHWDALLGRAIGHAGLGLAYPLASDPALELPVACTAIDVGGLPGVDERARDFARGLIYRRRLPEWSVMLVKGANKLTAPALDKPTWEVDDTGKRRKDAVALNVIGVHAIKDAWELRLQIPEPGPGYLHIPLELDEDMLAQMRGEERIDGLWVRKARNETWDLMVYNDAARLRLRTGARIDWANPPIWAKPRRRAAPPDVANAVRTPPRPRVAPSTRVRPRT